MHAKSQRALQRVDVDPRPARRGQPKSKSSKFDKSSLSSGHEETHIFTPWLDHMPRKCYVSSEQKLHHEILAYEAYIRPTQQESSARHAVFSLLQTIIQRCFGRNAGVDLHGSSATGLCLPTGDIDVTVTLRNVQNIKRTLFQLSNAVKASGIAESMRVNHWARVPVFIFNTLPHYGSFSVDIGINNSDGMTSRDLINDYLIRMPTLRYLVLVIKAFIQQRGLNNPSKSGIGSYAITCMCISFIQLNPCVLPEEYFDNPLRSESLGILLMGLLDYYALKFPYSTSYISVTEGKLLLKSLAEWVDVDENFPGQLVIQCLVHPDRDISKSLGRVQTQAIIDSFKNAYAKLLQSSSQEQSTLGDIIGVDHETITHRTHIKHIIDCGQLRRAERTVRSYSTGLSGRSRGPSSRRMYHEIAPSAAGGSSSSDTQYSSAASILGCAPVHKFGSSS